MTNEQLWQAALGELELSISKANFTTWFKNTGIASKDEKEIIISVPNGFTKEWLENKYHKFILKAIQNICPTIRKVSYKIGKSQNTITTENSDYLSKKDTKSYETASEKVYNNTSSLLNPQYTFENFIVGSNNELAYAACLAVSKKLGTAYNPLFIYGGVGLGKTHLLQSIGNEILKKDSSKKVKYASSEEFTNELINAISGKNTKSFKEIYRKIDILIIDDIQFLAGKEKTQEEFFHTFNTLYENNKQIVKPIPMAPMPRPHPASPSDAEPSLSSDWPHPELKTPENH